MYQLSPSGLEFSVPAHMTVDVSSIMATSDATEFNAKVFPGIITTALDGMGVEVLDNLALTVDADANSFLLGGDVSHFSGFVVGGNSNLSASIEKVPQFWPANTDFGPVEVNVSKGARTIPDESLIIINYSDNSVSPVIIKGTAFRALSPTPAENQTKTYLIEYACGDPGVGTYKATLLFVTYSTEFVLEYEPEEINIASAFLFGAAGPIIQGGESTSSYRPTYHDYQLHGTRIVNCGGSTVVEATPTPASTPTEEPTSTPQATPEETATPATPQTAPTISANTLQITIDHKIGETGCPTAGQKIVIQTNGSNELQVNITENLSFLTVSTNSVTTSGGKAEFTPSFPCSGYQLGANTGVITVTAVDPGTGLTSNTLQIQVTVNVN